MRERRDDFDDIRRNGSYFSHQTRGFEQHDRDRPVHSQRESQEQGVYRKSPPLVQNNREKIENSGRTRLSSGLNRFDDPVSVESGRFGQMGSVHRGGYSDGSGPVLSEPLLGEDRKSNTCLKFQWDNLSKYYGTGERSNLGGVPVSLSMENDGVGGSSGGYFSNRNMQVGPTESCRNYRVMDSGDRGDRGFSSSPPPLGVRRRSSDVDSIVDKIERRSSNADKVTTLENKMTRYGNYETCHGSENERDCDYDYGSLNLVNHSFKGIIDRSNDIEAYRNELLNDRRMSFGQNESDLDCNSLNLVKRRRTSENSDLYDDETGYIKNRMIGRRILLENDAYRAQDEKDLDYRRRTSMMDLNKTERNDDMDNDIDLRNNMMTQRQIFLENDRSLVQDENDLDYRAINLLKMRKTISRTEQNDDMDNDIDLRNNMMSQRQIYLENDSSIARDENDLDYRAINLLKMRRTINKTEQNGGMDNDIDLRNYMMSQRQILLENDSSFGDTAKDLDIRSSSVMNMRRSAGIMDRIEGNSDINNEISFRKNLTSDRRKLLENNTSFAEVENEMNRRSSDFNPQNLQFVEEYDFQRHGAISGIHEELYSTRSTSQRLVSPEETLEMRFKRKRGFNVETQTGSDIQKGMSYSDLNDSDKINDLSYGDEYWSYEDIEKLSMLQNSRQGQHGQVGRRSKDIIIDKMAIHGNANFENSSSAYVLLSEQRHLNKPAKSDVKKRLGPVQSVMQRLGPVPSLGKSLRLAPKIKRKLPWVNTEVGKATEDFEQEVNVQDIKSSEIRTTKQVMSDPPEGSEEAIQMVQNAFLKFVKVLNENSGTRQKYLEKGGGALKCFICGSSKEFVDTLSLAQHAFTSCKVGSRSEHLGFGKALCVLMGWNSVIVPNGRWIQQILPAAEASSAKEDLTIWPPVVLIHNSSIENGNQDERMIVSIERLRDILKGMGCQRGITNICRGKAANQSIMVVNFSGTFSGLQEAERLHKAFYEKKHGRTEFEQITSKMNSQETHQISVDEVENVLYGYMGIAGDLDNLDFGTKKRCVVKSKKAIAVIADASLTSK
ncbi:uncharacterized protein LOC126665816 [Mercurialis annua]|uniref:uncharacterized protein LOC126665816 n=1 Tax=Mercurialis annua TaxID=3986 RepID=UPI00215E2832|nr:uncharacterized protein LOC126665816 [Mercurialis annua]